MYNRCYANRSNDFGNNGNLDYLCRPYDQPYYPRADYSRGYDAGKTFVAVAGVTVGAILCYYLLKKLQEK